MSEYCAMCEGEREGEGVRNDRCIAGVIGEMNEDRKAMVRKVSFHQITEYPPYSMY